MLSGYRSVPLKNSYSEELELASLLVHIEIVNAKVSLLLFLLLTALPCHHYHFHAHPSTSCNLHLPRCSLILTVAAGGGRREPVHVHPEAAGSNQRAVDPGFPPGEVGLRGSRLPAESGGAQSGSGPAQRAGGGSKPQVTG